MPLPDRVADMRRRDFLGVLSGVAVWPMGAHAQQAAMPVIGFLNGQSADGYSHLAAAFRRGLREAGYVNGQNAIIEYRWAEGRDDNLPKLAADLVARGVTVLVSGGGVGASIAAHKATRTVPIVFIMGSDPVKYGLVASFNRPGGNATGVNFLVNQLNAKRLELAVQLVPNSRVIGFMVRPSNPASTADTREVETGATRLGVKLLTFRVEKDQDFDAAFAAAAAQRVGIVLVHTDPFFYINRSKLVALAERHAVPAMYELREFVMEGGLASYGTNIVEAYRQLGLYAGRVVKGEKPSDLPVMQSTHFELAINLQTAKALGIVIPQSLLVAADEVIE
jgi:putative tryptophan/tyrosine transport system substrate-binding protein